MSAPPAPLLNGITQIALGSADPEKLAGFYQRTLGLERLFDTAGMIFLQAGALRLMIGPKQGDQTIGGDSVLYFEPVVWRVAEAALERDRVTFLNETAILMRAEGRELALRAFKDPEGHALALFGWRQT